MTLGEYIKNYREEHNLSMRQFATLAGISVTYVSSIEKGATYRGNAPAPSISTFKGIASATGISVDDLMRMCDDNVTVTAIPAVTSSADKRLELLNLVLTLPDSRIDSLLAQLKK